MLTITDLPADIHDTIAAFLPNKDLIEFVCASRHIVVSPYLLRQRQRAFWKRSGVVRLARKGDLAGLQYLHGLGQGININCAMDCASRHGHLAVVQFLHSIGAPFSEDAMDWAAEWGHLAVVQFLHGIGIGAPFTDYAMNNAAKNGHLAVVQFLHSIGAPLTNYTVYYAASSGHLAVVEFLHSIDAPTF